MKTFKQTSKVQIIDFGEPIQVWFKSKKGTPYGIFIPGKAMAALAKKQRKIALMEVNNA